MKADKYRFHLQSTSYSDKSLYEEWHKEFQIKSYGRMRKYSVLQILNYIIISELKSTLHILHVVVVLSF